MLEQLPSSFHLGGRATSGSSSLFQGLGTGFPGEEMPLPQTLASSSYLSLREKVCGCLDLSLQE